MWQMCISIFNKITRYVLSKYRLEITQICIFLLFVFCLSRTSIDPIEFCRFAIHGRAHFSYKIKYQYMAHYLQQYLLQSSTG